MDGSQRDAMVQRGHQSMLPLAHADDLARVRYACASVHRERERIHLNTGVIFDITTFVILFLIVLTALATMWALLQNKRASDTRRDLERDRRAIADERQQVTAAVEVARAAQSTEGEVRRLVHEMSERLLEQQQTSLLNAATLLEQRAESHSNILRQAAETDAHRRMETLQSELAPVRRGLTDLARQLAESRTAAATEISEFGAMLRRVTEEQSQHRDDTRQLHRALRSSHVRGLYGELTLQRTLEHAGLEEGMHFLVQPSERDEEGACALTSFCSFLGSDVSSSTARRRWKRWST